ncbi:SDR family NAD(P)-dependent oxidoreductase [Paenibacillus sp. FSL P2-0136]|uniref:SDR family NAD(P)-dependent oxidoreductase n=1 Tax=Paenibacillus sp. FSL P2-0136 TaxID=2975317 RepID=UPI0030D74BF1
MENFLCKLLWGQMHAAGLFGKSTGTVEELRVQLGRQDHFYGKWLTESLSFLEKKEYLTFDGTTYWLGNWDVPDLNVIWKEWEEHKVSWMEDSDTRARTLLAEMTLRAIPDILTGAVQATEVIFPDGSIDLVEGIYKQNPTADFYNETLADTVEAYLRERIQMDKHTGIRILEVGAGTGGTTASVLARLGPYRKNIVEYTYTDMSKAFLMHAKDEFGWQHPYLSYQILNAEEAYDGQGIERGSYDLVIAANVLHATRNIRRTLGHAKAALKTNGLLILNEITENTIFNHVTFGLLEGWWLAEDTDLRLTGCPCLSLENWETVLTAEGFRSVFFVVAEPNEGGQQIIVTESDGWIKEARSFTEQSFDIFEATDRAIAVNPIPTAPTTQEVEYRNLTNYVKETVIEKLCELLKVDASLVDPDEAFSDYGLDSITGVRLVQSLNRFLSIELRTTDIFNYSTVNQLADHIMQTCHKRIVDNTHVEKVQTSTHEIKRESEELSKKQPVGKQENSLNYGVFEKGPIAIIGMSGRFAKSQDLQNLWEHLVSGDDLVEEITRWDLSKRYTEGGVDRKNYCNHGSFLEDVDCFDPMFFSISGVEASYMDPQQRVFLEESWKALEDAGYAGSNMDEKRCGVYVGCQEGDYHHLYGDHAPAQSMWGRASSIIPARIAYYLNLQGPAVTVDTACSSSLVAIHLACQSLWSKETEMALAGGVTIRTTPEFIMSAEKAGMLSPKGHCHAFDESADGFVFGEGVGVVVLKRLQDALADGDHIHGVIRGSGINQDGKTNGITAPSSNSQERLECQVYEDFHIDPGKIQVVEAHGTGTKLGDPIEFEALTRSFRKYTGETEYCAIGSIKTNLGHTVTAAGVAGVLKILLSLKHNQIPPSLHYRVENPNITFKGSPFYVNTRLKDWEIEEGNKRIAAVSSFGFSGTNAHLVIEEAPRRETDPAEKPGYLIVLSARTAVQLREQAKRLITYVKQESKISCANMSFTLLKGRKHWNHRMACVVRDREDLQQVLEDWLDQGEAANVYIGEIQDNAQPVQKEKALINRGNQCLRKCNQGCQTQEYLENLVVAAKLFTTGYELDFDELFRNEKHFRAPLPVYPFAKERYWVQEAVGKRDVSSRTYLETNEMLHPLLHRNTSTLSEQRFSSIFTGNEFFLRDHVVKGQRVLPGVAYLEMIRAAIELIFEVKHKMESVICLKNVVWLRPFSIDDRNEELHIRLMQEEKGNIDFEIYGNSSDGELLVHCQGTAFVSINTRRAQVWDLAAAKERCDKFVISSSQGYEKLENADLRYGPVFRGLEVIFVGENEALGKLTLPKKVFDIGSEYMLHPGIMDAALQTTLGLMLGHNLSTELKTMVPFALQRLEVLSPCSHTMWALVSRVEHENRDEKMKEFNITLYDEHGHTCVTMTGVLLRVIESIQSDRSVPVQEPEPVGEAIYHPVWKEEAAPKALELHESFSRHMLIMCEPSDVSLEEIQRKNNGIHGLVLSGRRGGIAERYESHALRIMKEMQEILRSPEEQKVLVQLVIWPEGERQLLAGLLGLLRCARAEDSRLTVQLLELEREDDPVSISEKLKAESHMRAEHVRYSEGKRKVINWTEAPRFPESASLPWRENGVYLITGGGGELGRIFAREIVHQVQGARIVLTGRSALEKNMQDFMDELNRTGAQVEYRQTDMTEKKQVDRLIKGIAGEHGELHGIIHGAGVIRDRMLMNKTSEEFREVLNPKVKGLVNLDKASRSMPLDFFVLLSSWAGIVGNAGQADYAAANAFMDAYADYRREAVTSGVGSGRTVSICWPLWEEGGMKPSEADVRILAQKTGMNPISTQAGISLFYGAMETGVSRLLVAEGSIGMIKQTLLWSYATDPNDVRGASIASLQEGEPSIHIDMLLQDIKKSAALLLKLKPELLDGYTELSGYGFDSIMLVEFADLLNDQFDLKLTPAHFFEYTTLQRLVEYLAKEYRNKLVDKYGSGEAHAYTSPIEDTYDVKDNQVTHQQSIWFEAPKKSEMNSTLVAAEPIAIVGVSGVFPMAKDTDDYWNNLINGRDCISKVPANRKEWLAYADKPRNNKHKTNVEWGGFLETIDEFDPFFFGISPKEAECMDPQQRLLMTYVWKVIEDAGYSAQTLSGTRMGILVGTAEGGYSKRIQQADVTLDGHTSTGTVPSIGPNRMSYFLNIHGPSEPIETACSSSLVAIHRAVSAIQDGSCEMAIAGGVNTLVDPLISVSFAKAGMLCPDGRCKTFSGEANGYVRGEGVGMLFLKRLSAAERDGDHIYAVIRGTSVNHGGRSNSLTAPNSKAQADLLIDAYRKAGVDPRTVTYIETHGTGTKLGDPVEINGLRTAFQKLYEETGDSQVEEESCGLGAVKSNIGHLELAAGVAGVIKVLLQMRHKTLVKSLHCENINPYIELQGSPFYIVQENREWKALRDSSGRELPRRAGVSSFGFGGVNAHLVLEEYIGGNEEVVTSSITQHNPGIYLLSAKNKDRLKEQAGQLLQAIETGVLGEEQLADAAFTLQVGREPMEERLAIVADSVKGLKEKLSAFMAGREDIPNLYQGQVQRNNKMLSLLSDDDDLNESIHRWMRRKKYVRLLELWVQGLNVDWNRLYEGIKPRRISLPTYPFAREHYWMSASDGRKVVDKEEYVKNIVGIIHPLVHLNTSTFTEQRYSSVFMGTEFFLCDHRVKGNKVLPAVTYLEMVLNSLVHALELGDDEISTIQFKDFVWIRPLSIGEAEVTLHIRLMPKVDGEIHCELFTETEDGVSRTHCEGTAWLDKRSEMPLIDLAAMQNRCSESVLSAEVCYEMLDALGMTYGPQMQGIERVYVGDKEVLAKISLSELLFEGVNQYILHPTILDAALQAAIGFFPKTFGDKIVAPMLPFTMEKLHVTRPCSSTMWAFVYPSKNGSMTEKQWQLDMDLIDEDGRICVTMTGVLLRVIESIQSDWSVPVQEPEPVGEAIYHPVWKEEAAPKALELHESFSRHMLIMCEPSDVSLEEIQRKNNGIHGLVLSGRRGGIAERYESHALRIMKEMQEILRSPEEQKVLVQLVIWPEGERQLLAGLLGLLRCARAEDSRLTVQLLELEREDDPVSISEKLKAESHMRAEHVRYSEGKRKVINWTEAPRFPESASLPWRENGVYLITGGGGELGRIFAREIVHQVQGARIVLTGRSALEKNMQDFMDELNRTGAQVEYRQTDMTEKKQVDRLIKGIAGEHGELHGIIHGAGVIRDRMLMNKTSEEFREVLNPKVKGLVNLDKASRSMPLDFFVLLSSWAGIVGNAGQADYAAANAFMDAYADYRREAVTSGVGSGRTVSICWPLWEEGGMKPSEADVRILAQKAGMNPISTQAGISLFYGAMETGVSRLLVAEGSIGMIKQILLQSDDSHSSFPVLDLQESSNPNLESVCLFLTDQIYKGEITEDELLQIMNYM